jgi:hypothetical protein
LLILAGLDRGVVPWMGEMNILLGFFLGWVSLETPDYRNG